MTYLSRTPVTSRVLFHILPSFSLFTVFTSSVSSPSKTQNSIFTPNYLYFLVLTSLATSKRPYLLPVFYRKCSTPRKLQIQHRPHSYSVLSVVFICLCLDLIPVGHITQVLHLYLRRLIDDFPMVLWSIGSYHIDHNG